MNVIDLTDDVKEHREELPVGADISADVIVVEDEFGGDEKDDSHVIVLDDDEDDHRKKESFLLVHSSTLQGNHHNATDYGSQTSDGGHGATQRRRIVSTGSDLTIPNHVIDLSRADVDEQHQQPNESESILPRSETQWKRNAPHTRKTPPGTDSPPPGYQTKGRRRRRPETVSEGAALPKLPTSQYPDILLDENHSVDGDQQSAAHAVSHSNDAVGDPSALSSTPLTEQSYSVRSRQRWSHHGDNWADQGSSDVRRHGKPHSCSEIPFHDDQPTSRYKLSYSEHQYQQQLHEGNMVTYCRNVPSNQGPTGGRRDQGGSRYRDKPARRCNNTGPPHPRGGFTRNHQNMPQQGYKTNHGNRHWHQGQRSSYQEPRSWEDDQARATGGWQNHRSFAEPPQRYGVHQNQNRHQQHRLHQRYSGFKLRNHDIGQLRRTSNDYEDNQPVGGARHRHPLMENHQGLPNPPQWRAPPERTDARKVTGIQDDAMQEPPHSDARERVGDNETATSHHHPFMENRQDVQAEEIYQPHMQEDMAAHEIDGISIDSTFLSKANEVESTEIKVMMPTFEFEASEFESIEASNETVKIVVPASRSEANELESMVACTGEVVMPEMINETGEVAMPILRSEANELESMEAPNETVKVVMTLTRSEASELESLEASNETGKVVATFSQPDASELESSEASNETGNTVMLDTSTVHESADQIRSPRQRDGTKLEASEKMDDVKHSDTFVPSGAGAPYLPCVEPRQLMKFECNMRSTRSEKSLVKASQSTTNLAEDDCSGCQHIRRIIENEETRVNCPGQQPGMFEPVANGSREGTVPEPLSACCKHDARASNFVDLSSEAPYGEDTTIDAREQRFATPSSGTAKPTVKKALFRAKKRVIAFELQGSSQVSAPMAARFGLCKGRKRKAPKLPQAKQPASHPKLNGEENKGDNSCFRWTFYDQNASKQNKNTAGKRQRSSVPCNVSKIPDEATDRFFKRSRDYNFSISEQDALELQEKLFREAAARVRAQKTTYGDVGAERQFMEPIQDIARLHPNHWTWSNPYSRLGLPPGAPLTLIKLHYRKLALKYHPDKCHLVDAANRFQAVTGAYQSLMRPGT